MRGWRALKSSQRWVFVLILALCVYGVFLYHRVNRIPLDPSQIDEKVKVDEKVPIRPERISVQKSSFPWDIDGEIVYVEELLTNSGTLQEKFTAKVDKNASPKILVSINAGHSQENLNGCKDWNCVLTTDRSKVNVADAVMLGFDDGSFKPRADQYVIYFSQESPKNAGFSPRTGTFVNMTLGFRHDTPASSPYGYTIRLAPQSYNKAPFIDAKLVKGKSKEAAWFVSHCSTNSKREDVVKRLKKDFEVDVFGACGTKSCPRGGSCEDMLDTDYHFYFAFENSLCKDYLTEKLWNQGYKRHIIPVVMSRKITEDFVPPNSFIAVDDFKSIDDMASYLHYLMKNQTAYMEYFNWREKYRVIFLDGKNHDVRERPWGFCQVCRLMWENPKKYYSIDDFSKYWYGSCEQDGTLAHKIMSGS